MLHQLYYYFLGDKCPVQKALHQCLLSTIITVLHLNVPLGTLPNMEMLYSSDCSIMSELKYIFLQAWIESIRPKSETALILLSLR